MMTVLVADGWHCNLNAVIGFPKCCIKYGTHSIHLWSEPHKADLIGRQAGQTSHLEQLLPCHVLLYYAEQPHVLAQNGFHHGVCLSVSEQLMPLSKPVCLLSRRRMVCQSVET